MGQIIAVANQKGGVAKTTTTLHLGAALGSLGQRVLLVDLDPQGSLTLACGLQPDGLQASVYHPLIKGWDSRRVLHGTSCGADLIPANIDLSLAEMELVAMVARERRLGGVLAPLRDDYDFVLIDCHPSFGLLTINALAVADQLLVPVACEFLSTRAVHVLLKVVGKIRLRLNSRLRVAGIVPTLFDTRTRHSREMLQEVQQEFGRDLHIFPHPVHRSVRFAEAAAAGKPVFDYAPDVPGARAYQALARQFLARNAPRAAGAGAG